jgi:hypothetical protein
MRPQMADELITLEYSNGDHFTNPQNPNKCNLEREEVAARTGVRERLKLIIPLHVLDFHIVVRHLDTEVLQCTHVEYAYNDVISSISLDTRPGIIRLSPKYHVGT